MDISKLYKISAKVYIIYGFQLSLICPKAVTNPLKGGEEEAIQFLGC